KKQEILPHQLKIKALLQEHQENNLTTQNTKIAQENQEIIYKNPSIKKTGEIKNDINMNFNNKEKIIFDKSIEKILDTIDNATKIINNIDEDLNLKNVKNLNIQKNHKKENIQSMHPIHFNIEPKFSTKDFKNINDAIRSIKKFTDNKWMTIQEIKIKLQNISKIQFNTLEKFGWFFNIENACNIGLLKRKVINDTPLYSNNQENLPRKTLNHESFLNETNMKNSNLNQDENQDINQENFYHDKEKINKKPDPNIQLNNQNPNQEDEQILNTKESIDQELEFIKRIMSQNAKNDIFSDDINIQQDTRKNNKEKNIKKGIEQTPEQDKKSTKSTLNKHATKNNSKRKKKETPPGKNKEDDEYINKSKKTSKKTNQVQKEKDKTEIQLLLNNNNQNHEISIQNIIKGWLIATKKLDIEEAAKTLNVDENIIKIIIFNAIGKNEIHAILDKNTFHLTKET
ncbi:MAG: hypothetical protein ACTSYF_17415, partial [Promethearchaeota archaeon]